MTRREPLELAPLLPTQPREQRIEQRDAREVLTARDPIEPRREPFARRGRERSVRKIRPRRMSVIESSYECDTRLQVPRISRPGQRLDPELANAREHRGERFLPRDFGQRALLQHQTIEPQHSPREDGLLTLIPLDRDRPLEARSHQL